MTFHTPSSNRWQNSSTHQEKQDQPKTLFDTAVQLTQNGISVQPVGGDKLPYARLLPIDMDANGEPVRDLKTGKPKHTWKPYQAQIATLDELSDWFGPARYIATIGGEVSDGTEIIL